MAAAMPQSREVNVSAEPVASGEGFVRHAILTHIDDRCPFGYHVFQDEIGLSGGAD
jgi:hypothetical protein